MWGETATTKKSFGDAIVSSIVCIFRNVPSPHPMCTRKYILKYRAMRNPITATYIILLALLSACAPSAKERNTALVAEWIGRELIIPTELVYTIMGDTIAYDPLDADYTIVAYINSPDCTECHMRLPKWSEEIIALNMDGSTDVNFLMIAETDNLAEVNRVQKHAGFAYPIATDPIGLFRKANSGFPTDERLHAFLLDSSGKIVAIGSPVLNPNLRKVYLKAAGLETMDDNLPVRPDKGMKSVGALAYGDSTMINFTIYNASSNPVEVSGVVESCSCMNARYESAHIPVKNNIVLSMTLNGDTVTARNSVEVYFADTEIPLTLKTISYAKKQSAASQVALNKL